MCHLQHVNIDTKVPSRAPRDLGANSNSNPVQTVSLGPD